MPKRTKKRVIVDTNCWISFLIGQRLQRLTDLLSDEHIQLIICDELLDEIQDVTSRPKFTKYFPPKEVDSLIEFLRLIGESINPHQTVQLCRDASDDYLLALAIEANADYLVTGDYDLLVLNAIEGCQIVNVETFERAIH
jgi:hypothetical protein